MMTITPRITLNNVSFRLDQTPVRFDSINLSFERRKYGIIGRNGVGKTAFLKLLLGELLPERGSIQRSCKIIDVPQSHSAIGEKATVGDVLGVASIIQALDRIHQGSVDLNDFDRVSDDWDIEKRIADVLTALHLWPIDLNHPFQHLSGGQKTKVLLAKTWVFPAGFLIFDEPTNNLDTISRDIFYQYVDQSNQGLLIVSHDRKLLNKCDKIVEITTQGIETYGGNYGFYVTQKDIKQRALAQEIQARTENLKKTKQLIQARMERHQQNESRGRKGKIAQIKGKGSYNKIEIKSKKGKSENTNRRIRLQADKKFERVNAELTTARAKLEAQEKLDVCLSKTSIPSSKIVVKVEDLCFSYDAQAPLIDHFNLQITGPERIAIAGPNGCGKSTFIKLIRGVLVPQAGNIKIGVETIAYLDQSVSFLEANLSIVDNFLKLNPECKPFDAYSALASFKFRNKDAEKRVGHLSGGEKMRAGLAVSLMSKQPPQLIILDEPTNHLDLESLSALEEALKLYQGAILAVSHDEVFLRNIYIQRAANFLTNI